MCARTRGARISSMTTMSLAERWRAEVRRELDIAVELRHALHRDPRLSGDESDTARRVAEAIGVGDGRVVAGTGRLLEVTGTGPAIAVRAELDALPIVEATDATWASTTGAMHACGHDIHLAAATAVARAAARVDLPYRLVALLQPREEPAESGARDVIAEGGLDGIWSVIAGHVQPRVEAGVVATTPGPVNAAIDRFTVTVHGQAGHSAYPHTVTDSVLALAEIVVSLQQVATRRVDPVAGAVCMVTQLEAGTAYNVVPGFATAIGSLRTMRENDRSTAHLAIREIAANIAAAHRCTAEASIVDAEPVLVNDAALAERAAAILTDLGRPITSDFRSFGSDDFSHYGAHARSLMMFVGTGSESGGLHDPTYLPDDRYVELVAEALIAGYCAAAELGPMADPSPT